MRKVDMHRAKANLSELVRAALEGQEVVITRAGEAVVRLVPFHAPEGLRPVGLHRLPPEEATEDFFRESMRPMSSDKWSAWTADVAPHEDPI